MLCELYRVVLTIFCYIFVCSGQRVIVQEKKEDQVVENVVTIQVRYI